MPIVETRELRFDEAALISVLAVSRRAAERFGLRPLPASGVWFLPATGEVEIAFLGINEDIRHCMCAQDIGGLLICYCIRASIPIPRQAAKSVHVEPDAVTLVFRMGPNRLPVRRPATRIGPPPHDVRGNLTLQP